MEAGPTAAFSHLRKLPRDRKGFFIVSSSVRAATRAAHAGECLPSGAAQKPAAEAAQAKTSVMRAMEIITLRFDRRCAGSLRGFDARLKFDENSHD